MNEKEPDSLRETAWRRPLTGSEWRQLRERMTGHDGSEAEDWQEELALTRALASLPDSPVASNFTSRVMHEIEREEAQVSKSFPLPAWRRWVPRIAFATVAVGLVWFSAHRQEIKQQKQAARELVEISEIASVPSVEVLKDFEAIHRMSQTAAKADLQLLAAFE